jgi:eukaryotic-like serine/threonine-protein kinase
MASDAGREQRLNEILAAYLEAVEAGRKPDRRALLRKHPDLAAELRAFFDNQDHLLPFAAPLRSAMPAREGNPSEVSRRTDGATNPDGSASFGGYELLEEISRGGMGVVYKARHIRLNRVVALKTILAGQLATAGAARRFRSEAEAAASLDHPHIVPIYEVGEYEKQQFYSMRLIEGQSLAQKLASRSEGSEISKQEQREAARLIATVAKAVHHAHERGILHRDLKPANILLDVQGQPHVTDFGLAKRVKGDGQASQSVAIVGTASYMSPEQAQSIGPLTVAADVYSLGAILYELLTGQVPFRGNTYFDTLLKVVDKEPERPKSINSRVDGDLEKICLKCLAKQPEKRYASAAELATELEHWLAGEQTSIRPLTDWERFRQWCRRKPVLAGLVLLTAGTLVTAMVSTAVFVWHITEAQSEVATARDEAYLEAGHARRIADRQRQARAEMEEARKVAQEERDKNRQLLASQYVANGTALLEAGDLFGALVRFGEVLHLDQGDPLREEMHRVRLAATLRRCPRLLRMWFPDEPLKEARLSPDGRLVLAVGANGHTHLWDAATGKEVGSLSQLGGILHATFSPDGKRLILAGSDQQAHLWDVVNRQPWAKPLHHDGAVNHAAFGADGSRVITASADQTARIWDTATGLPLSKPLRHDGGVDLAVLSPDGSHAATASTNSQSSRTELRLWEVGIATVLAKTAVPQRLLGVNFSADGRNIITLNAKGATQTRKAGAGLTPLVNLSHIQGGSDNWFSADKGYVLGANGEAAKIWDASTGQPIPVSLHHRADVHYAAFAPGGRSVLTAAWDRTARVWDVAAGEPLTPPLRHGQRVVSASFNQGGTRLLTLCEDQTLRLWDLAPREGTGSSLISRKPGVFHAFSPDGRHVLAPAKIGLRLWDATTGKPAGLAFKTGQVIQATFSPDGKRLLVLDQDSCFVCDPVTGNLVGTPRRHKGDIRRADFTPDGSRVVCLDRENLLQVWDMANGKVISTKLPPKLPWEAVPVSPDGRRYATLKSRQVVEVVDLDTQQPDLPPIKHSAAVVSAAFSPDGKYLATACADGAARVWDLATAAQTSAPLSHGRYLQGVSFSLDGRLLATLGSDGTARVWETGTGQAITPYLPHGESVTQLTFSPDGRRLVTAAKSRARVWDLRPDSRPLLDLVRLVQLSAGQHTHAQSGNLVPLERGRLRRMWEELSARYPEEFASARP